jgi:hypothetical protein
MVNDSGEKMLERTMQFQHLFGTVKTEDIWSMVQYVC